MPKINQFFSVLLTFLLVLPWLAIPARAAEAAGFSARPVLPENQVKKTQGYFDLVVEPGQSQELEVVITNKVESEITILVDTVTASTNSNGLVNYTTPGQMDETLTHRFDELAAAAEEKVTIPGGESAVIHVSLQIPQEPFDGIVLGSIQMLREVSEEELRSDAMIINQYSYIIGVRLRQNDTPIAPEFQLGEISAALTNRKASVVAQIRNTRPLLVKDMSGTVKILSQKDRTVVFERTKADMEMAPNSVMSFRLEDEAGYGVQAGSYLAAVQLEYQGEQWYFEQEFTIQPEQAARINQNALNQTRQTAMAGGALPGWAVALMIVGIVLLLLAAMLLALLLRRARRAG